MLDLSEVVTAIKLWMMLCREKGNSAVNSQLPADTVPEKGNRMSLEESEAATKEGTVWNEVWPPFEHVLTALPSVDGTEPVTVRPYCHAMPRCFTTHSDLVATDAGDLVGLRGPRHLFPPNTIHHRAGIGCGLCYNARVPSRPSRERICEQ